MDRAYFIRRACDYAERLLAAGDLDAFEATFGTRDRNLSVGSLSDERLRQVCDRYVRGAPPTRVRLLLVAELDVPDTANAEAEAQARLDAFREAVLPSWEHGVCLYRVTPAAVQDFSPTGFARGEG